MLSRKENILSSIKNFISRACATLIVLIISRLDDNDASLSDSISFLAISTSPICNDLATNFVAGPFGINIVIFINYSEITRDDDTVKNKYTNALNIH